MGLSAHQSIAESHLIDRWSHSQMSAPSRLRSSQILPVSSGGRIMHKNAKKVTSEEMQSLFFNFEDTHTHIHRHI